MIEMDSRKIIIGALFYAMWSALIGYLIAELVPWAMVISALVTGIYCGLNKTHLNGMKTGFIAALIGGLILGVASLYLPTIYDIPLSIPISGFLNPFFNTRNLEYVIVILTASLTGAVFGTFGGLLGSISELKTIFFFLTLFTLFLFYTAFDNVAWFWGKEPWNWSLTHVLTHWVDITVALIFSAFVTLLSKILKVY